MAIRSVNYISWRDILGSRIPPMLCTYAIHYHLAPLINYSKIIVSSKELHPLFSRFLLFLIIVLYTQVGYINCNIDAMHWLFKLTRIWIKHQKMYDGYEHKKPATHTMLGRHYTKKQGHSMSFIPITELLQ